MIRRSLVALSLLPLSALAQTQVPNVFEDGTPATAAEVNENFQYVMENASGGCSATQQDNSVLIECADGTSGVIAGAGTVVIYPEGQVGEAPPLNLNSGQINIVDGNETYLAPFSQISLGDSEGLIAIDGFFEIQADSASYLSVFYNHRESETVYVLPKGYSSANTAIAFLEPNCAGEPYLSGSPLAGNHYYSFDNQYYRFPADGCVYDVITKSVRFEDEWSFDTGDWIPDTQCTNLTNVTTVCVMQPITPPAAWENPVYPVDIRQEP